MTRRVTELEGVLGTRPGTAGLRARVEEMSRTVTALGNAQAKLARESKGIEDRIGSGKDAPSELAARMAKLEEAMALASTASDSTAAAPSAALSAKLAEIERAAQAASDAAKSARRSHDDGAGDNADRGGPAQPADGRYQGRSR